MNSFLIQCKVRKAELLQFLGITAVGYLIGLIVVFIVMNVAKENTCATKALSQAMYFLICWRSQCWNLRSLCLV